MLHYLLRRLGFIGVMLGGIMALTFLLSRVLPGDPARLLAGPRASAETVARVREIHGLDLPLWEQFLAYCGRLLTGDLGNSIVTNRPVLEDIARFFPATLELVIATLLLATLLGVAIGLVSAIRKGGKIDTTGRFVAIGALSLPDFWIAILAQLLFFSVLSILPFGGRLPTGMAAPEAVTGLMTVDALLAGRLDQFGLALKHLLMPACVLALPSMGLLARIVRATALEVLGQDYVRTAHAKGIRPLRLYLRHVLKNALLPVVTFLGLLFGFLLSGAVLVELVFAWPGIGRYTASAISATDYNAIMGVTIVVSTAYLLINFVVDLLYTRIDPRVRLS